MRHRVISGFGHESEVVALFAYVRFREQTGKHLLSLSFTGCDPNPRSAN
jgi:erythromycin esterase-like protein